MIIEVTYLNYTGYPLMPTQNYCLEIEIKNKLKSNLTKL
jgi:hypothetical protein